MSCQMTEHKAMTEKVIAFFLVQSLMKVPKLYMAVQKPKKAGEFTASKFSGNLLGAGQHLVTIESVQNVEAAANELFNDRTPQLAVKFKNDSGTFTNWYNLVGYKKFDELSPKDQASGAYEPRGENSYATNVKTGTRVHSAERTAAALSRVGQLGTDALNLAEGEDFNGSDLIGAEVGINIEKNDRSKLRVTFTMPADEVEA